MRVRPTLAAGALSGLALVATACGTPTTTPAAGTTTSSPNGTTSKGSGPVNVAYAASLEDTMNNAIGPAFNQATGYTFVGFPGGSTALEHDISGKVKQEDVFISASRKADIGLEGASNGNWVSWYATFATTKLVLGYNPRSRFASQLKTKPWYQVVGQSGFRLGFTNPATDPKGVLAVAALDTAATRYNEPALKTIAKDVNDQYPESALVGRLQSGELDAGFFYTVEATAANLTTVSLDPVAETGPYTITVLKRAPNAAGANAFVEFLLSTQGQSLLTQLKLTVTNPPKVVGSPPTALSSVLPSS